MEKDTVNNMLVKVLDPTQDITHPFISMPKIQGWLGRDVIIEAPFTCTYGYKIKVSDNTYIGSGCDFDDANQITIGHRSWIGPNVTIQTSKFTRESSDSHSIGPRWLASPVSIGPEAIIGANTCIFPGVTIGRGSRVEPGAVVRCSLGEFEIQQCP